jgi:hypothetical protein
MAGTQHLTLASDSWTAVAAGPAHPYVVFEGVSKVHLCTAAAPPLIGETNIATLSHYNKLVDAGELPAGMTLYMRADAGSCALSVLDPGGIAPTLAAGEAHLGEVGGRTAIVGASFARPADNAAYAIGDAILDSTTAATVNANVTAGTAGIMRLHVGRATDKTGMIRRLRLKTNDTTFAGATIRVHLYKDRPTVTNGDNGAWLTTESTYIGYADIVLDRHFSDAEKGIGTPSAGSEWNFDPSAGTDYIHAILETRTAIAAPGSAKTWTLTAETLQN